VARVLPRATIRAATLADVPGVTSLVSALGYPAEGDRVAATLGRLLVEPACAVLVAEDGARGILGLVALSSRPVLRLQGVAGRIEELVVRPDARGRDLGNRLLQYAKGLAVERGWVRLEMDVPRPRTLDAGGFLLGHGFCIADAVTYRWGRLEASHPPLPVLGTPRRDPEFV
jgi:GNAT superfamily N-acetyltransferase